MVVKQKMYYHYFKQDEAERKPFMRRRISAFALVLIMVLGLPVSVSADTSTESGKTVINSVNLEVKTTV